MDPQPPPPFPEPPVPAERDPSLDRPTMVERIHRFLICKPRDLKDSSLFSHVSLIPFLAWVGLGADGLSSSCYGPEEAFRALGEHTYLASLLALAVIVTVCIISAAYAQIIEEFPHGGGGYTVATTLLGERIGVASGCALLVDYVLTITVSMAAAGDALFSLLPIEWHEAKLEVEFGFLILLTVINLRGVRESVLVLLPIFLVFLATHILLILGSFFEHVTELPALANSITTGFQGGMQSLGWIGMTLLFFHAYSLGGGTYTGLESVSNGLMIMREPRVRTAKVTMVYMAVSLSITASGLLLGYLLIGVTHEAGKTFNAILAERLVHGIPMGMAFVILTLITEGGLLVVAAQAGLLAGPRVLANMAADSWVPRKFGMLSDRLTIQNGILVMGAASLLALLYTHGNVQKLVIMYSINVFLTFSLSMFGMLKLWYRRRIKRKDWKRHVALFGTGLVLCVTILGITIFEKFSQGGWVTLVLTGSCLGLCYVIRGHYRTLGTNLRQLDTLIDALPEGKFTNLPAPNPMEPTAAVLVGSYGGTGVHLLLTILRAFPNHFKNFVFISVGVIDTAKFKSQAELDALEESTRSGLEKYVDAAARLGFPATSRMAVSTDVLAAAEQLCREVHGEFPLATFFAGQVIFRRETWYHSLLHNQTSFDVQKRLHVHRLTMVILPIQI
jgi:amino acid transporter